VSQNERDNGRVLVVLGAAVHPGGIPSPTLRRRTEFAGRMLKQRDQDLVIVSGGVGRYPPAEALVMRDILTAAGVAAKRIVLDDRAANTFDTARFTRDWLARNPGREVVLITDSFHCPRSLVAFRGMGVRASAAAPLEGRGTTSLLRWVWSHLREIPAMAWYLLRVLLYRMSGAGKGT